MSYISTIYGNQDQARSVDISIITNCVIDKLLFLAYTEFYGKISRLAQIKPIIRFEEKCLLI